MRISQLITRLQGIQSRFGDPEVNNVEAEGRGIQHRYPWSCLGADHQRRINIAALVVR